MSYGDKVWAHLQKYGSITAKGVEDITGTTCPHGVIRDIRKKYGYDCITFEDRKKVKKFIEDGKEIARTIVYREWFLRKMEG
ncbi:MAG: hypothetical protein J6S67_20965 [Methanobrevibacter sp.]|nr:hypothetical protein [Methanobrevibacter sp.]